MSPRGGKREGAGRKPLDNGVKRRHISMWLPAETLAMLDRLRGDTPRSHLLTRLAQEWIRSHKG